ncbi:MAG: tetrahydrofolate dehydrogenase/cyclohydrolase catalytic domain-containing protein, partial [Gaiellaceae bacterium]
MPATPIKGKPIADRIRAEVAEEVRRIGHIGLVTVLVGDDPASEVYIRLKHKAATEAGFDARDVRLPADITEQELLERVAELNADDEVDAMLVQLGEELCLAGLRGQAQVGRVDPRLGGRLVLQADVHLGRRIV